VKKTLCFALLLAYLIPFIVFLISTLRLDLNGLSDPGLEYFVQ
jgi:hypothetical protein